MPRRNYEERKAYQKEWARQRTLTLRELKKDKPCADCGIVYDPVCMDWDHIVEGKSLNLSKMNSYSMDRVLAEIALCELVCSNCHRLRTLNRRGIV